MSSNAPDFNTNGKVDVGDAQYISAHEASNTNFTIANFDTSFNLHNKLSISNYLANLINSNVVFGDYSNDRFEPSVINITTNNQIIIANHIGKEDGVDDDTDWVTFTLPRYTKIENLYLSSESFIIDNKQIIITVNENSNNVIYSAILSQSNVTNNTNLLTLINQPDLLNAPDGEKKFIIGLSAQTGSRHYYKFVGDIINYSPEPEPEPEPEAEPEPEEPIDYGNYTFEATTLTFNNFQQVIFSNTIGNINKQVERVQDFHDAVKFTIPDGHQLDNLTLRRFVSDNNDSLVLINLMII